MGEQCFAAHSRTAEPEMKALASEVMCGVDGARRTDHLQLLLAPYAALSLN